MSLTKGSNRLLRFARLTFALCMVVGVSVAVTVDHRPLAERANAWAVSHRGVLPSTLGELMAYPYAYRQAIIRQLPTAVRDSLWKRQLELALASHPNWSAEQQASVRDWASHLGQEPADICARIAKMFPDPAGRSVFAAGNLGTVAAPSWTVRSWLVAITEAINGSGTVSAGGTFCSCYTGFTCSQCSQGQSCQGGSCTPNNVCTCLSSSQSCDGSCGVGI